MTLALCFTESGLNYNVKHNGKFDSGTKGICGIKPCWNELLGKVDRNSLQAGSIVIGHLLTKHKLYQALQQYKGAVKDRKQTAKVLKLKRRLDD